MVKMEECDTFSDCFIGVKGEIKIKKEKIQFNTFLLIGHAKCVYVPIYRVSGE